MTEVSEKYDDLFESLSTWKKWDKQLSKLRNIHWKDVVLKYRIEWKTPNEVKKILETN